jgi:general secretion pathway protein G
MRNAASDNGDAGSNPATSCNLEFPGGTDRLNADCVRRSVFIDSQMGERRMSTEEPKPQGTGLFKDVSRRAAALVAIATVLGVVFLSYIGQWQYPSLKGNIQTAKTQVGNFATALDAFQAEVERYPTTAEGLRALVVKPADNPGNWAKPFLMKIPRDPWGHEYQYVCPGVHNTDSYDVCSFGPDGKPGGGDDIVNWEETSP